VLTDLDVVLERNVLDLNILVGPLVEELARAIGAGGNVSGQIESSHFRYKLESDFESVKRKSPKKNSDMLILAIDGSMASYDGRVYYISTDRWMDRCVTLTKEEDSSFCTIRNSITKVHACLLQLR
jgi:hypothetical protein